MRIKLVKTYFYFSANNIVTRIFHPLIKSQSLTPFVNENEKEGIASLELVELEVDIKSEDEVGMHC